MSNDLFSLNGKVALVTGSSTGLGKVMARALGRAGAKVAQNYFHNEERAAQAFAEFQETGAEGAMFRADVTDEADVNRLVAEATELNLANNLIGEFKQVLNLSRIETLRTLGGKKVGVGR